MWLYAFVLIAFEGIKDVKSENILVVLHATDSRVTVKRAAKSQAEELLLDDKAILTNDQAKTENLPAESQEVSETPEPAEHPEAAETPAEG